MAAAPVGVACSATVYRLKLAGRLAFANASAVFDADETADNLKQSSLISHDNLQFRVPAFGPLTTPCRVRGGLHRLSAVRLPLAAWPVV